MAVPECSLCGQAFAAASPLSRHKKGAIYRDSLLVGLYVSSLCNHQSPKELV